jgi:hypothetical protein
MKSDYKEAVDAISALKQGDVRAVEAAIRFLKADKYSFPSGYLKEDVWRYLKRVPFE